MKVLLVEDEKNLGEYIKKGLTEAGFIVDHHMTGLDGYHALMTEDFSVVLMDVMPVSYTHLTLPTTPYV